MSVVVRPARTEDLPRLAALAAELVRVHHRLDPDRFFLPKRVVEGYLWWFERELANEHAILLAAEQGGTVVGYAYGRIEDRDFNMLLDKHGALHDVLVDESVRGARAGEALVRAFCAEAKNRGAPRVVLHAATGNDRAQALFAKLGFRPTMVEMMCSLEDEHEPNKER